MASTTILTILTSDHREVAKLLDTLEKTTPRSARKRQELFAKVDQALSFHADFEEAQVYPLLEARKSSKPTALEAVEEHVQIKRLLAELRTLDPQDERWAAKLTVLAEDVRHHVKEEESEAFPELRKAVPADELSRLGEEYLSGKADSGKRPSPARSRNAEEPTLIEV